MRQYNHRVGYNIMAIVQGQPALSWQGGNHARIDTPLNHLRSIMTQLTYSMVDNYPSTPSL